MTTPTRRPRASLATPQSVSPSKPLYVEIDDLESEKEDYNIERFPPTKTPIRTVRTPLRISPGTPGPSHSTLPTVGEPKNEDPEYTPSGVVHLLKDRPYIQPLHYQTFHESVQRHKHSTFKGPQADPKELDVFLACTEERFDTELTVAEARLKLGMTPDSMVLPGVQIPLLDHQITGVATCIEMEQSNYKGGIVADEMGLGKTVQMIAVMLANPPRAKQCKTTLIVTPLALLTHWQRELEKAGGVGPEGIKYLIYHGPAKPKDYRTLQQYDVVLTTYGTISNQFMAGNSPLFHAKMRFLRIVLDEGHYIRNPDGKASQHVAQLDALYRWVLTGTPIINRLFDVYPSLRFLRVPYWHNRRAFRDEIAKFEGKNPVRAVAMLQTILDQTMLRRLKSTLLDGKPILDLPDKTVSVQRLDFSDNERRIYDLLEIRAQDGFKRLIRNGELKGNMPVALTLLLRLRQACSHPALVKKFLDSLHHEELAARMDAFLQGNQEEAMREIEQQQRVEEADADEDEEGEEEEDVVMADEPAAPQYDVAPSTKMKFMMDYIRKLLVEDPTAKIIVISQWTQFLSLVADYLTNAKITYLCYQGSMNRKERDYAEREFGKEKGTAHVLLLSLQCGGAGLNLTRANHIVCLDLGWSHAVENQAYDRVHRYGQTRPVFVQRVIIANTVEERILSIQDRKKSLADGSLGEGNGGKSINSFGPKELAILFGVKLRRS